MTGILVVLEGRDFSGKTKQRAALAKLLRDAGHEVVETREPGGTPYAEEQREMLFKHKDEVSARTELLALQAARSDHIEKVIVPAAKRGAIILCDRFFFSTYAYQVHEEVRKNNGHVMGLFGDTLNYLLADLPPTLQLLLEVSDEEVERRRQELGARNPFDDMRPERVEAINEAYAQFHVNAGGEFTIIKSEGDFDQITQNLRVIVEAFLMEVKQAVAAEEATKANPDQAAQQQPKEQVFPPMDEYIRDMTTSAYQQLGIIELIGEDEAEAWRAVIIDRMATLNAQLDKDEIRDGQRYPTVAQGIQWLVGVRQHAALVDQFKAEVASKAAAATTPAEAQ